MAIKFRDSNFELMRLISMFFIVMYHFIIPTGGNLINTTAGMTNVVIDLICLLIVVHVNSFVLITGYFQCEKKFSWKKVLSLIGLAWFYKLIIGFIFLITGAYNFNLTDFVLLLSPFEFENNWFLTVYISLYLLSPYINVMLDKLNQKNHRKLVLLLIVMFSIIPTITNQHTFSNYGFSIIHFVFIYILGAYLKKYPISQNIHFKNYSNRKRRFLFFGIFLFCGIFNFLLYEFCENVVLINNNNLIVYMSDCIKENMFNYQNPILIIQSIAFFLIFENIKLKNKWINKISGNIFAIYIITENPYLKNWLYPVLGFNGQNFHGPMVLFELFGYSILIFIICIIIEIIRKMLTNIWKTIFQMSRKKEKIMQE